MEEHEEGGSGAGHESSERWLVSYADFITLLFALFVLLYAVSNRSKQHRERIYNNVANAVGARPIAGGMRPGMAWSGLGGPGAGRLAGVMRQLNQAMMKFPKSGVTLKMDSRGLVISLSAARFFASGDADITPSQLAVLDAVIKVIAPLKNAMEIDGFTDSKPIHNSNFRDNWELSAARAGTVLRYVLSHSAINPQQLSLAGYGPYRPVASNATAQGRALNRRVEIVIKRAPKPL
jgi:chemotaxis protein MotB